MYIIVRRGVMACVLCTGLATGRGVFGLCSPHVLRRRQDSRQDAVYGGGDVCKVMASEGPA